MGHSINVSTFNKTNFGRGRSYQGENVEGGFLSSIIQLLLPGIRSYSSWSCWLLSKRKYLSKLCKNQTRDKRLVSYFIHFILESRVLTEVGEWIMLGDFLLTCTLVLWNTKLCLFLNVQARNPFRAMFPPVSKAPTWGPESGPMIGW